MPIARRFYFLEPLYCGCSLRLFLTTPPLGFLLVLVLVLETCKKLSEDEDENEDEEDGLSTVSSCTLELRPDHSRLLAAVF